MSEISWKLKEERNGPIESREITSLMELLKLKFENLRDEQFVPHNSPMGIYLVFIKKITSIHTLVLVSKENHATCYIGCAR